MSCYWEKHLSERLHPGGVVSELDMGSGSHMSCVFMDHSVSLVPSVGAFEQDGLPVHSLISGIPGSAVSSIRMTGLHVSLHWEEGHGPQTSFGEVAAPLRTVTLTQSAVQLFYITDLEEENKVM